MKPLITLILMLTAVLAQAGGYSRPFINSYDAATGLYYKSVASEQKGGFLSSGGGEIINLYIFDPSTETGRYLVPQDQSLPLVTVLFETSIKDGEVQYHGGYSARVMNNQGIDERPLNPKLLLLTYNEENEQYTFYTANKDGTNLEKSRSFGANVQWHLDAKNSKVRLVQQKGRSIQIESFAW